MRLFYSIWVDCIIRLKAREKNKNDWKLKGMISMTLAMTFNFVLIMVVLQREILGLYFYEINLPSLSGFANYVVTIILLYILPCVILNYFLIFRNKKYERLQNNYRYHNGKLFLRYFLLSISLPIVLLWIGVIWRK
jgi:hypothetical protein